MTSKDKFVLVLNGFELLSCIVGMVYYRKLKNTKWRWFVVFLLFTFATEMVAKYINHFGKGSSSFIYIYFNLPGTFLVFLWLFYKWFTRSRIRWIAVTGMIMYVLAWGTEEIFFKKTATYFGTLSYQVAAIFLLLLSIVYYITLTQSQSVIHYQKDSMFWIVTGILIFYFVNSPMNIVRNQLNKNNPVLFFTLWKFSIVSDCLMYILFIIGIKWGNPKSSYSQVSPLSSS